MGRIGLCISRLYLQSRTCLFGLGIALAFCCASCSFRGDRLVHFSRQTGFVYQNISADHVLFSASNQSVFPICDREGNMLVTCPLYENRRGYVRIDDIEPVTEIARLWTWQLKLIEVASNTLHLSFQPQADATPATQFHPTVWIEPSASTDFYTIHIVPALPIAKMYFHQLSSQLIQSVEWKSFGSLETILLVKTKPVIGIKQRWNLNNQRLDIEFREHLPVPTTLVIDPGHGFHDRGGCVKPPCEADLTLTLGLALKSNIKDPKVLVLLTRETDKLLALEERLKFALDNNADLFTSLHFDHWTESFMLTETPKGTTCYFENWLSYSFAHDVCLGIRQRTGNSEWITQKSLYVTHRLEFPSILIEMLNLAHDADRKMLMDSPKLNKQIQALAAELSSFIRRHQK